MVAIDQSTRLLEERLVLTLWTGLATSVAAGGSTGRDINRG
jgi:hypothetical protein